MLVVRVSFSALYTTPHTHSFFFITAVRALVTLNSTQLNSTHFVRSSLFVFFITACMRASPFICTYTYTYIHTYTRAHARAKKKKTIQLSSFPRTSFFFGYPTRSAALSFLFLVDTLSFYRPITFSLRALVFLLSNSASKYKTNPGQTKLGQPRLSTFRCLTRFRLSLMGCRSACLTGAAGYTCAFSRSPSLCCRV